MGLISLDRLIELKKRIDTSIDDYKYLLNLLEENQKNLKDLESYEILLKTERELILTLEQRVRTFKAHYFYLVKMGLNPYDIDEEVTRNLLYLKAAIKETYLRTELQKEKLEKEINSLKGLKKIPRSSLDLTAQRIEILT